VIAISQSGITKTVIKGVELAREKKIKVIAITANSTSAIADLADYVLIAKGDSSRFDYYKNYNHLSEMAVIEALIKLMTNPEQILKKNADVLEVLLSDAKL
jgi:DNA-binding MurR/RpiR family transcriptional regulator